MAAGAIKKDDRNNRILADAKSQVERLKTSLPQLEQETLATKNGEPEAKLAIAYFTLKNYAKATEAAQRGIDEGSCGARTTSTCCSASRWSKARSRPKRRNAFKAAAAANEQIRGVADLWSSIPT